MPRSPSTYSLPPGTTPQQPNTVISSSMFNAFADDVAQTFNTVQPIVYGGTGSNDLKLTDTDFGIKDNGDPTKIGQFNASGLPTATTRTYDLPYYSGTLGLVSDIRGQIYGLLLSNNVTDPTNDINIAPGTAVDIGGSVSIQLLAGLTKRLDAPWAAGTNQGGRFDSAIADATWHHYLIRNPTTGAVDVGMSTNANNPTTDVNYPGAYTQYRRIGSIPRTSGSLIGFTQAGDRFVLNTTILTFQSTALRAAAPLGLLYTPSGIATQALIRVKPVSTTGNILVVQGDDFECYSSTSQTYLAYEITAQTNSSAQITVAATGTPNGSINWQILVKGWIDYRRSDPS